VLGMIAYEIIHLYDLLCSMTFSVVKLMRRKWNRDEGGRGKDPQNEFSSEGCVALSCVVLVYVWELKTMFPPFPFTT